MVVYREGRSCQSGASVILMMAEMTSARIIYGYFSAKQNSISYCVETQRDCRDERRVVPAVVCFLKARGRRIALEILSHLLRQ